MTSTPAPVPEPRTGGHTHRVSDAEREQTAEALRVAAGDGRLTIVELEERLDQAYGARTYGELERITHDLPGAPHRSSEDRRGVAPSTPPADFGQVSAVFGEVKRHGGWRPPQHLVVRTLFGAAKLDFTEAELSSMEITLDVNVLLGEAQIRVPEDAIVHLDGSPILGEISEVRSKRMDRWDKWWHRESEPPPEPPRRDGPVFHINARSVLGEVKVHRGPSRWRQLIAGR